MNKDHIVKKNYEYERIIKTVKPFKEKDYIIYVETILETTYRFGISVSKKVGNAVIRNKIKRQIKSILSKQKYNKTFNCLIIVKKSILQKEYNQIEKELNEILKKYCLKEDI